MNNELIQTAMIFMRAGVAAVILDVSYDLAKTILLLKNGFIYSLCLWLLFSLYFSTLVP